MDSEGNPQMYQAAAFAPTGPVSPWAGAQAGKSCSYPGSCSSKGPGAKEIFNCRLQKSSFSPEEHLASKANPSPLLSPLKKLKNRPGRGKQAGEQLSGHVSSRGDDEPTPRGSRATKTRGGRAWDFAWAPLKAKFKNGREGNTGVILSKRI